MGYGDREGSAIEIQRLDAMYRETEGRKKEKMNKNQSSMHGQNLKFTLPAASCYFCALKSQFALDKAFRSSLLWVISMNFISQINFNIKR